MPGGFGIGCMLLKFLPDEPTSFSKVDQKVHPKLVKNEQSQVYLLQLLFVGKRIFARVKGRYSATQAEAPS